MASGTQYLWLRDKNISEKVFPPNEKIWAEMVAVCENALREGGWREGDGGRREENKNRVRDGEKECENKANLLLRL